MSRLPNVTSRNGTSSVMTICYSELPGPLGWCPICPPGRNNCSRTKTIAEGIKGLRLIHEWGKFYSKIIILIWGIKLSTQVSHEKEIIHKSYPKQLSQIMRLILSYLLDDGTLACPIKLLTAGTLTCPIKCHLVVENWY